MVADPSTVISETMASGLTRLTVRNQAASATLYLQGAHITSFRPHRHDDLLWVSPAEDFRPGHAIRGGIPICWPWFGPHPEQPAAPSHGLVRTATWDWQILEENDSHTRLRLSQGTDGLDATYPYRSRVTLTVGIGATLTLELTTENQDNRPIPLSQALHSYFPVGDLHDLNLAGLAGYRYFDKVSGTEGRWPEEIRIEREIDRIQYDDGGEVTLMQKEGPNLFIRRAGSRSLVVWNPWREKSRTLSNFHPTDYRSMLCLESANAGEDARIVAVGEAHTLTTEIGPVAEVDRCGI